MAIIDSLKSKKLPIGIFVGFKEAPGPASIDITLDYSKHEFDFCSDYAGFKVTQSDNRPISTITFKIPVMPPTIQIDFGNSKDSENVARVGEVVLPKYKKASQVRWSSFFPYDLSAPYLNTTLRNLSKSSYTQVKTAAQNMYSTIRNDLKNKSVTQKQPTPDVYIKIFKLLSSLEVPFTMSMTFYDGGNLPATKYTLDSFRTNPENNGDYSYDLSLIEWTDISPKKINQDGSEIQESTLDVSDKQENKTISSLSKFVDWCKKSYPTISNKLLWAVAKYNGVRNFIFDTTLKLWKIKGTLKSLGGRFGIVNNILGVSKITRKDTTAVSNSLKKLSFTKASKQMAELLKQNTKG